MKRPLIVMLGLMLLARTFVQASTIPIGVLSFDVFTPAANGSPGANTFNISDFTGAFDLPPDFSAATALTLMNATLTADPSGGPSQVIPLGNIGPGPLLDTDGNPPLVLQFPSTTNFTSVSFMAILGPTTFALSDGGAFVAGSAVFATLSPSSGSLLVAGIDNALISAQPAATVPEPRTLILVATATLVGTLRRALRNSRKSPPSLAG